MKSGLECGQASDTRDRPHGNVERSVSHIDSLRENLGGPLGLPDDAVSWLLSLWGFIQTFDDIVDGDSPSRADLDKMLWAGLVNLPTNSFYLAHINWLAPVVASAVLEWMASDYVERLGNADAQSYVWRAGFYRVVCAVCGLVHGPSAEISAAALSLYGETLDDYLKEFGRA